jgi:hypothetical protein
MRELKALFTARTKDEPNAQQLLFLTLFWRILLSEQRVQRPTYELSYAATERLPSSFVTDADPRVLAKGFLGKLAGDLFRDAFATDQLCLQGAASIGMHANRDRVASLLYVKRLREQCTFARSYVVDGTTALLPVRASCSVALTYHKQRPLAIDDDFVAMLFETAIEFDLREA